MVYKVEWRPFHLAEPQFTRVLPIADRLFSGLSEQVLETDLAEFRSFAFQNLVPSGACRHARHD